MGVGGRSVAVGLGGAWVAVARSKALYKLHPRTGRVAGQIRLASSPQSVAVGHGAVWVGLSTLEPEVADTLVRIDARTLRVTREYPVAEGIRTLVAAPSGIWVVHRHNPAVSRFDLAQQRLTRRVAVGQAALGAAAYGAGAVWVTSPEDDAVTRIDDRTGGKVSSRVGRPTGIAARGRQIWVTSFTDHTITRIDPKTSRPAGRPVDAPLNPYALAVTDDAIWVTAVGNGEVARARLAN